MTARKPVILASVDIYESNWGETSMPWQVLVRLVHKLNSWERRITCITHPEAVGIVDSEKFGGIRTEMGPAGYVLSTGERVTL